MPADTDWTTADSDELYHVRGWGNPYFSINDEGNVVVDPTGQNTHHIDLFKMVQDLIERGHECPFIVRFSDILSDRVRILNQAFAKVVRSLCSSRSFSLFLNFGASGWLRCVLVFRAGSPHGCCVLRLPCGGWPSLSFLFRRSRSTSTRTCTAACSPSRCASSGTSCRKSSRYNNVRRGFARCRARIESELVILL